MAAILTEQPLSFNQEGRLLLEGVRGSRAVPFHVGRYYRVVGALDVPALERALARLVHRHHALRTGFDAATAPPPPRTGGAASRAVDAPRYRSWVADDAASSIRRARAASRDAAMALLSQASHERFTLDGPPLLRLALVETEAHEHFMAVVAHHLVSDRWSLDVLCRELLTLYEHHDSTTGALPEVDMQCDGFARLQRDSLESGRWGDHLTYWNGRWAGYGDAQLRMRDLGSSGTAGRASQAAGYEIVELDPALDHALRACARRHRTTPYVVVLTAFVAALHALTQRTRVAIWGHFANRVHRHTESTVGWLANAHLLGAACEPATSLGELLAQLRATVLDAYEHQEIPPAVLWSRWRGAGDGRWRAFLSDAWVSFDFIGRRQSRTSGGVRFETIRSRMRSTVPGIQLYAVESPAALQLVLIYSGDHVAADAMRGLLAGIATTIEAVATTPERTLSRVTRPTR